MTIQISHCPGGINQYSDNISRFSALRDYSYVKCCLNKNQWYWWETSKCYCLRESERRVSHSIILIFTVIGESAFVFIHCMLYDWKNGKSKSQFSLAALLEIRSSWHQAGISEVYYSELNYFYNKVSLQEGNRSLCVFLMFFGLQMKCLGTHRWQAEGINHFDYYGDTQTTKLTFCWNVKDVNHHVSIS